MNKYEKHALEEFRASGWIDGNGEYCDEMQEMICEEVIKLLNIFAEQRHSGSSAPYAINLFEKLARFEPIAPLTGEDWEWNLVSTDDDGSVLYQNKRMSSVFKRDDRAYWLEGKIFWEWDVDNDLIPYKSYFTSKDSNVDISFPFSNPKSEYVFCPTKEFPYEEI